MNGKLAWVQVMSPVWVKNIPPSSRVKEQTMQEFLCDLWDFLKVRKKIWLLPIFIFMMLLGGIVVATQQSSLATFIYTLF